MPKMQTIPKEVEMKKEDYIKALKDAGKKDQELKGLKVKELKDLYKKEGLESKDEYDKEPVRIISKRKDGSEEYWLENGAKVKFQDCKEYFQKENAISPPHKAKDYCQRTKDGVKLFFRDEV